MARPQGFAERSCDLVIAVNAAFTTETAWASAHSIEADTSPRCKVITMMRFAMFISWKRQYHIHRADDQAFLAELQRAADWLSPRSAAGSSACADPLALV